MKTRRALWSILVTVGVFSLRFTQPILASGGTSGGVGVGVGTASGGGGHGSGGTGGAMSSGHVGSVAGSRAGITNGGTGFRSMAATYNGAPHYLPGGFAPGSAGRFSPARRSASQTTVNRPVYATQQANGVTSSSRAVTASRPANSWTETNEIQANQYSAGTRQIGAKAADRQAASYAANQSDNSYRQYIGNGNYNGLTAPDGIAGTYLYPGAYGSALNRYFNGQIQHGALGVSGSARSYAQPQNWYGPNAGYHPYWPNGYRPFFGTYGYGYPFFASGFGYPYFGYYGGETSLTNDSDLANGDQSVATVDTNPPGTNDQPAAQPDAASQDAPAAPPANPDRQASSGVSSNGPDSLIEAVQAELARRGYFTGKVNAMYGPTTREALRRFQGDAGLAATGRINEATMHALELD